MSLSPSQSGPPSSVVKLIPSVVMIPYDLPPNGGQ